MRDFYMVDESALPPGRWFLGDFHSSDFQDRRRLDSNEPCKGVFTIDPGAGGRPLNFSLTAFGLPIATLELAKAIVSIAGEDLYLVPARIKGYGEFRVVQCLRVLDCVDEARSKFEIFGNDAPTPSMRGEYRDFSKLIIDPARIPENAHMFFVAKWCVRPIVSGRMKHALMEAGDLGVNFISVNP